MPIRSAIFYKFCITFHLIPYVGLLILFHLMSLQTAQTSSKNLLLLSSIYQSTRMRVVHFIYATLIGLACIKTSKGEENAVHRPTVQHPTVGKAPAQKTPSNRTRRLVTRTLNWNENKWSWSTWGGGWGPSPTKKPTQQPIKASDSSWGGKGPDWNWVLHGWNSGDVWANDAWTGDGWHWSPKNPTMSPLSAPPTAPPTPTPTPGKTSSPSSMPSSSSIPTSSPSLMPTPGPSSIPSLMPSTFCAYSRAPTLNKATEIKNLLVQLNISDSDALDDKDSPQACAFKWVTDEDLINPPLRPGCNDARIIQRYVLAVLYCATNGIGWMDAKGWLSEESECEWYRVDCDSPETVTSLALWDNQLDGNIPRELGSLSSLGEFHMASDRVGCLYIHCDSLLLIANFFLLWFVSCHISNALFQCYIYSTP